VTRRAVNGPSGADTDVIVVGSGIAGLGAARHLAERGLDVVVLEKEREPGGRMRSVEAWDGLWVDLGAEILPDDDQLGVLASTLGLDSGRLPYGPDDGSVTFDIERDGQCHRLNLTDPRSLFRFGAMSRMGRLRVATLIPALVAQRVRNRGTHYEAWRGAPVDRDSAEEWLSKRAPELLEYVMEPSWNLLCGWEPADVSRGALLYFMTAYGDTTGSTFHGGVGALSRTLAATLDVRTGHDVTSVDVDRACVTYCEDDGRSTTLAARAVVVAVTGDRVSEMTAGLDPAREEFFRQVRYVPHSHAFFELLGRPVPGVPYVLYPRAEDTEVAAAGCVSAPTDPSVDVFRIGGKAAFDRRHAESSDDEIIDAYRALAIERFPRIDDLLGESVLCRWKSALPTFHVGYLRALAAFHELPPLPRAAFAGDYLAFSATSGAYESGVRAARQILEGLGT